MNRLYGYLSAVTVAATLVAGSASAMTLAEAAQPAETPSASYSGDVYVDSRGCAYARVTLGSTVNWVPRLTGSDRREVVCGLTPTNTVGQTSPSRPAGPVAPQQPAKVQTARATTPSKPAATALRSSSTVATTTPSTTRTLAVTCPAGGGAARVLIGGSTVHVDCAGGATRTRTTMVRHSDGKTTRLIVKPSPAVIAQVETVKSNSMVQYRPATASTQQVVVGGTPASYVVQTERATLPPAPRPLATVEFTPSQKVVVRDVAPTAVTVPYSAAPVVASLPPVPAGYRAAWDDDRLNPNRGPRTAQGEAQMAMVWTNTVPRKLVKVPMVLAEARGYVIVSSKSQGGAAPLTGPKLEANGFR